MMKMMGVLSLFLYINSISFRLVNGDRPIGDPNLPSGASNAEIEGSVKYNLIETDASCFYNGVCPMFPPGGKLSVFPNSEEKFQHLLHNLHRMQPNQSMYTPLGKYMYGTWGDRVSCPRGSSYCGNERDSNLMPLYWYSPANAICRFKQWDEKTCDQSWYDESGQTLHSTCGWGQEITMWGADGYCDNGECTTQSDRCLYFTQNPDSNQGCEWTDRTQYYNVDDNDDGWWESEALCAGNSCFGTTGHSDPFYQSVFEYVGKGFAEGTNGACSAYSRSTREIYYELVMGTHFDERIKIAEEDHDADGKHFNLMLEYYDHSRTQTPSVCYAMFDGSAHEMDVYVSNSPHFSSGWDEGTYDSDDYHVIFQLKFDPPPECQPYSFLCKTSAGNFIRLPEDNNYYFGTDWWDYSWSDYEGDYGYSCKEQHYHNNGEEWIVNGGPAPSNGTKMESEINGNLTTEQIWYYVNGSECIGCQYIDTLVCNEECIYTDKMADGQCSSQCSNMTPSPTTSPTVNPTFVPTVNPTFYPTANPTVYPTLHPTVSPSPDPTPLPTPDPIIHSTDAPSLSPTRTTMAPTISPTVNPTSDPTKEPITRPTIDLTVGPSPGPTSNPTYAPTSSPISELCLGAKYRSSMRCNGDACDSLWGGEYMASSDCRYFLKMEHSGNLRMYKQRESRRRLLDDLVIGWSSNTSVSDGIPKMTLFSNGNISGFVIYEMESRNDTNPISLWNQTVASNSTELTLSLSDEATLDLSDESGELWSETVSFPTLAPTLEPSIGFVDSDDFEDTGFFQESNTIMYVAVIAISVCVLLTIVIAGCYYQSMKKKSTNADPEAEPLTPQTPPKDKEPNYALTTGDQPTFEPVASASHTTSSGIAAHSLHMSTSALQVAFSIPEYDTSPSNKATKASPSALETEQTHNGENCAE